MPRKHNPIMDREIALRSLTKAGRIAQPFSPIQAFDLPLDEYRIPPSTSPLADDAAVTAIPKATAASFYTKD